MLWVLVNLILPSLEFISPQEPPGLRLTQWLCLPKAGGLGSIPGQGIRSHMPELSVLMPQLRLSGAK